MRRSFRSSSSRDLKGIKSTSINTLDFPILSFHSWRTCSVVLRAVSALASLLLTRRKSIWKVSGCSGGHELTGRALLLHDAGPRRNCLFRQSSLYLAFALCFSQWEKNTNILQLQIFAAFVYVGEHIWACKRYAPNVSEDSFDIYSYGTECLSWGQ